MNRAAPSASHVREAINGFDVERSIAEFERAFITGAPGGQVAARKQPTRPGDDELLDLIALRAQGRYGFVAGLGALGARRGQLAPSRDVAVVLRQRRGEDVAAVVAADKLQVVHFGRF